MATLTFRNKHFNPVSVFWHKNADEVLQAILKPGESYQQASDDGDSWTVRDRIDGRVVKTLVVNRDLEVDIKEDARKVPVSDSAFDQIDASYRPETARRKNFALHFDGKDDRVTIPHSASLDLRGNWTVEAWVFRENKNVEQSVVEKFDGASDKGGYALRIGADNRVHGGFYDGADFVFARSESTIEGQRWYHIAATLDAQSGAAAIYVNGEFDGQELDIARDLTRNRCVLEFDGDNDYLAVDSFDVSESAYTLSLWFRCEERGRGIFSVDAGVRGASGHDRDIYLDGSGNLCAYIQGSETIQSSGSDFADGEWHHLSHVFGGSIGGQRLYVDGREVARGTRSSSSFNSQNGVNIGYSSQANAPYFKGQLTEVSVWNVARSESDLTAKWRQRLGGNESGLQALWHLDDAYGTTYRDSGPNHRDATVEDSQVTAQLRSMSLGGSSSASSSGIDLASKSFTFSCWAKRSATGGPHLLAGQGSSQSSGLSFGFDSSNRFEFRVQGNALTTSQGYSDSDWHHWSCTYDASSRARCVYRDGVQVASDTAPQSFSGSGSFHLGKAPWGGNFRGRMGEIVLWDSAHSENQVNQDRSGTVIGTELGLIAFWYRALTNDDTQTSGIFESSRSRRHATYSGSVSWQEETHPGALPSRAPRWNRYSALQLVPATMTTRESSNALVLGARGDDQSTPFRGKIDAIRIWNLTRTASQIRSQWNQALAGNEAGLQGYWRCDEGSDVTLRDSTANSNNGTLGGGQSANMPSWYRSSLMLMDGLRFDGNDDYIALPPMDPAFSKGITIEAWVHYDSFRNFSRIVELGNGSYNDNVALCNSSTNGDLLLQVYRGASLHTLSASGVLETNVWIHVAATIDAQGNATLYKNGTSVATGSVHLPRELVRSQNYIGRSTFSGHQYFHGRIDEVRIWRSARDDKQLQGYMRRELEPSDSRLVAMYSFDEGSGVAAFDQSASSLHGLLGMGNEGQTPTWLNSWERDNTGLQFDGSSDYVDLPDSAINDLSAGTIEAWVNLASTSTGTLCAKQHDGVGTYGVLSVGYSCTIASGTPGRVYFHGRNNTSPAQSSGTLSANVWHHVAVTFDRSRATIYIDGRLDSTSYGDFSIPDDTSATATTLGAWLGDGGGRYLDGILDEIRVWSVVRSDVQVQANMHRRVNPTATGLAAYWPVEAGTGTLLHDKTSLHQHGALGGGETNRVPQWLEASPIQFEGYDFDGFGDYVEIPSATAVDLTSNFTISAWIKPEKYQGMQTIVGKVTDNRECQYALSLDGEMLRFDYENEGNNFALVAGQIAEGWNHVAVVVEAATREIADLQLDAAGNPVTSTVNVHDLVDETITVTESNATEYQLTTMTIDEPNIRIYVNGLEVATGKAPMATDRSDAPVTIGAWAGNVKEHFFCGLIDSVVIRNQVLSQPELQTAMHQRLSSGTSGLAGYWRLSANPPASGAVNDLASAGNHGAMKRYVRYGHTDEGPRPQGTIDLSASSAVATLDRDIQLVHPWSSDQPFSHFAVEFWCKWPLPQNSSGRNVFYCDETGQNGFMIENGSFGLLRNGSFVGCDKSYSSSISDGWHHVALVSLSDWIYTVYIDGGWRASRTGTQIGAHYLRNIGNLPTGGASMGVIDEFRLWKNERTSAAIQDGKSKALLGTEENLLGYWRFEEGSGTQAKDLTPFRNHATVSGATWIPESDLGLASAVFEVDPDMDAYDFGKRPIDGILIYPWGLRNSQGVDNNGQISMCCYVKVNSMRKNSGYQPRIWSAGGYGDNLLLDLTDERRLRARLRYGSFNQQQSSHDVATSSAALELDQWYHVGLVVDGTHVRIYINGQEDGSAVKSLPSGRFAIQFSSGIGCADDDSTGTMYQATYGLFDGQVGEISIWNKSLSQSEVAYCMENILLGTEPDLHGYWKFEEQLGSTVYNRCRLYSYNTAYVTSSNLYYGATNAGWVENTGVTLKRPGTCLELDGNGEYLQFPSAKELELTDEDFTVEAWLRPSSTSGSRVVLGCPTTSDSPELFLGLKDGRPYMGFGTSNTVHSSTTLSTNQWTHVAWRYSAKVKLMTILVNGGIDIAVSDREPYSGTGLLTLGGFSGSSSFHGQLSDIAVWDHPRTSEEIRAGSARKYGDNERGLVAYWRLDGFYETTAFDSTARRLNCGLSGGRWMLREELEFNELSVVKAPTKAAIDAVEWARQQPMPDTPETRAQATNVVPAPSRVPRVTTLTLTSTNSAGTVTSSPDETDPEESTTFQMLALEANTDFLPEPFRSLADRIITAINDASEVPYGELLLTTEVLGPFDPFTYFFGTPAELLHIKRAYIQVVGSVEANNQSATGTVGLRLGGEVSLVGLPPVTVECDFYKSGERPHFPDPADPNADNGADSGADDSGGEEEGSGIAYTLKFHLPEPIGVGSFLEDIPLIGGIQFYKPSPAYEEDEEKRLLALIITNESDDDINMVPGLNAYGTLRVGSSDDPVFEFIGRLLGIDEIQLHVGVAPMQFNFDAVIRRDVEIIADTLWFKETEVCLELKTVPPEMSVALKNSLEAKVSDEILTFTGTMEVSVSAGNVAFGGALTMEGDWRNPFGINGVVISDLAAEIAGSPRPPWLNKIGYTGRIAVGKASVMMAVLVDLDNPKSAVIVGDAANIQISDIINTLCGPGTVPGPLADVLDEFHLRRLKVSIIPEACTIGEISFDEEGITVKVAVTIFGWNADLYLRADYSDGITAYATVDPISFAGIFELRESRSDTGEARTRLYICPTTCPERRSYNIRAEGGECQELVEEHKCGRDLANKPGPQMYLRISPYAFPELFISGYAEFLGISLDTFVHISSDGLDVDLEGRIWNIFQANLQVKAAWDMSYLYVKGEFRNDFFAKIREEAVKAINFIADKAVNAISGAQDELRAAQQKVEGLRGDVDRMRVQVRRERQALSRRMRAAQRKIDGAQREVNKLLGEIESTKRYWNSLPNSDWPWKPSKGRDWIWIGPKLAGLYIAYGVATAALQVAKLLLKGADWLVLNIPIDADPRILALWAAYGIATGVLKAAELALEGTKYIVKGAAFVAEQIVRLALGELFDIRYAMFEGEFGGDTDAKRIHVKAHIVFLKMNLHIDFELDFNKLLNPSSNPNGIDPSVNSMVNGLIDEHAA